MTDVHNRLLNHVRHHGGRGLTSAEGYLKQLARDVGKVEAAALCGCKSFGTAMKKAKSTLTYWNPSLDFKGYGEDEQGDDLPAHVIASVDSVVSTVNKDWDGDIVRPDGLIFDMAAPLLRGHEQRSVFGKMAEVIEQGEQKAVCKFYLADTLLAHDSLALMRIGALRKSIGFRALEAKPLDFKMVNAKKVPTGFDITKAVVMETSGVSIPANPGAEILSVYEKQYDAVRSLASKGAFRDPVMQIWGKAVLDSRPVQTTGATLPTPEPETLDAMAKHHKPADIKQKSLSAALPDDMPGSYEERIHAIARGVEKYLCDNEESCDDDRWYHVVATYPDSAIVCTRKWNRTEVKRDCFTVSYTFDDGKVEFTGHEKAKLTPVLEVDAEKAFDADLQSKQLNSPEGVQQMLARVAAGAIDISEHPEVAKNLTSVSNLINKSAYAESLSAIVGK